MKKIRKSNKGFTLVELIIVIAIIAVLAVVIAPQYIKYVERSRYSTDMNTINEIAHAMEIAAVGDGDAAPAGTVIKVTVATDGSFTYVEGASGDTIDDEVAEIIPADSYTFKSNTFKAGVTVTLTLDAPSGNVAVTNAPTAP